MCTIDSPKTQNIYSFFLPKAPTKGKPESCLKWHNTFRNPRSFPGPKKTLYQSQHEIIHTKENTVTHNSQTTSQILLTYYHKTRILFTTPSVLFLASLFTWHIVKKRRFDKLSALCTIYSYNNAMISEWVQKF